MLFICEEGKGLIARLDFYDFSLADVFYRSVLLLPEDTQKENIGLITGFKRKQEDRTKCGNIIAFLMLGGFLLFHGRMEERKRQKK